MTDAEHTSQSHPERATQKIQASSSDSTMMLRQKYLRRRAAIQRFTERLQRGGFPDEAEINTLREVGVSEPEIKGLVEQYSSA